MSFITPESTTQEYVYVIHAIGTNRVKLGFTTKPKERLAGLQTASPFPLQMLAYWPGNREREDRLHRYMDQFRKVGEWFEVPPFIGLRLYEIATKGEVTGSTDIPRQKQTERSIGPRPSDCVRLPSGYHKRAVNGAIDIIWSTYVWDEQEQKKVRFRPYVTRLSAVDVQRLSELPCSDRTAEIQSIIDVWHEKRLQS